MPLVHPLQEVIDSGLSQKDAAGRIGISPQYLCDLFQKRRSVGARLALAVQKAFAVDAMTILIRQAACDLAAELVKADSVRPLKAKRKHKEGVA